MKRSIKILICLSLGIVGLIITILFAGYLILFTQLGYHLELIGIKAKLRTIPDIKVIQVWGRNEDVTLQQKFARVMVKGKGLMTLIDLSEDSFDSVNHLRLLEIGDFSFAKEGGGWSDWVDIGVDGDVAEIQALAITNFQSAVTNFDTIQRIVTKWPREPERIYLENKENKGCFLSLKLKP